MTSLIFVHLLWSSYNFDTSRLINTAMEFLSSLSIKNYFGMSDDLEMKVYHTVVNDKSKTKGFRLWVPRSSVYAGGVEPEVLKSSLE